jgi:cytochrome c biogenesis protein ResB
MSKSVTLSNFQIDMANAALNEFAKNLKTVDDQRRKALQDPSTANDPITKINNNLLRYRVLQNGEKLASLMTAYLQARNDAWMANGAKHDGVQFTHTNGRIEFETPEGAAAANSAVEALNEATNTVEYSPLPMSSLAQCGVELDLGEILALRWMIIDDVE